MTTVESVSEANRTLGRRFFEEQDRLRGGPAEALCAHDYRARLGGNPPFTRDQHEGFARAFYGAFSDMRHVVEEVFATEDRAAVRFVLHGTHTGDFFGIPATGREVRVPYVAVWALAGDKITALRLYGPASGLMQQLTAPATPDS